MTKNKQLTLIALLVLLFFGCKKDDFNKYDRPTWLAGKLYTQMKTVPDISTFVKLVEKSGYDSIIDRSGSYTVFAPSNEAFTKYFEENPTYKSVDDLSKEDATKLVKYHIVQNPWSKKQLTSLDVWGWIDTLDLKNNEPKGYKRETLFMGNNQKVGVQWSRYKKLNSTIKRTNIIDTTKTTWTRRVFTDSRKFAPIFFKQYFDIYDLSSESDYEFYFGRQFESLNDIYFSGGRIVSDEMFAENGFVYVIDQVAKPLKNGVELLTDKSSNYSYTTYYNLVNLFSEFEYNEDETFKQPGADQGLKVDSLFNLRYPQLVFDINSEKTKAPRGTYGLPSDVTIRYHQGIVAPTDAAMNQLVNDYLAGGNNWGSIEAAPENIKRIIANSCLSINPIYLTDLRKGFLNGEQDIIQVDESSIVQKEYGSNCTFIGVNKPIVPRAFSSVTGPVYTRKGFQKVMFAIEKAGLLSALKRKEANYSFYVEPDELSGLDSSFIYEPISENFFAINLYPSIKKNQLLNTDLRVLLLNHIALDQPKGIARKEFIRNMAGNFLIYDNITKEVKGTAPSTYGYRGTRQVKVFPRKISTNSDNGTTYEIDNWFNFSTSDIFSTISTRYTKFHNLLKKAGYSQDKLFKYSFLSDNQSYTVFVPTDSAIVASGVEALTGKALQDFILLHFVQGEIIFTDGNQPSKYHETVRIDEANSTPYLSVYTKLRVNTDIDKITIPGKQGFEPIVINESPATNQIMSRNLSNGALEAYTNSVSTSVIHEIKKVLLFNEVDTQ